MTFLIYLVFIVGVATFVSGCIALLVAIYGSRDAVPTLEEHDSWDWPVWKGSK